MDDSVNAGVGGSCGPSGEVINIGLSGCVINIAAHANVAGAAEAPLRHVRYIFIKTHLGHIVRYAEQAKAAPFFIRKRSRHIAPHGISHAGELDCREGVGVGEDGQDCYAFPQAADLVISAVCSYDQSA